MRGCRRIFLLTMVALVLAACAGLTAEETAVPTDAPIEVAEATATEVVAAVEPLQPTDTEAPTEPPTDTPPTEQAAVVEETAGSEACTYKPNLAATDPATVAMASGGVQLVEFFAFW